MYVIFIPCGIATIVSYIVVNKRSYKTLLKYKTIECPVSAFTILMAAQKELPGEGLPDYLICACCTD